MSAATNGTIQILLIDDHEVTSFGLRMLIEQQGEMRVVGEARSSAEALEAAARDQPDVILLDLDLGAENGLDLITDLKATSEQSRILVVTGLRESSIHLDAVKTGAVGVVRKDEPMSVLLQAIRQVASGQAWLDPGLVTDVISELSSMRGAPAVDPVQATIAQLTERELEVIALICDGLQNKLIAQQLSISESTVRHHLSSIFTKLGVETRLELVIFAFRHQLVKVPQITSP